MKPADLTPTSTPTPQTHNIPRRPRHGYRRRRRAPKAPLVLFALTIIFGIAFMVALIVDACTSGLGAYLRPVQIVSLTLAAICFIALPMATPAPK